MSRPARSHAALQLDGDVFAALDAEFHFTARSDGDGALFTGPRDDADDDDQPLSPALPRIALASEHWSERNLLLPPFADGKAWIKRAAKEARKRNCLSVCIVPLRPNTKYWAKLVWPCASELRVLDRRIKMDGFQTKSPQSLCAIVYNPRKKHRGRVKFVHHAAVGFHRIRL